MRKEFIWDVIVNALYSLSLTYVLFQQVFTGRIGIDSFMYAALFSAMSLLYGYVVSNLKKAFLGHLVSIIVAIALTVYLVRYPIEVNIGNLAAELVTMYSLRNALVYVVFVVTPLSIIFISIGIYASQR